MTKSKKEKKLYPIVSKSFIFGLFTYRCQVLGAGGKLNTTEGPANHQLCQWNGLLSDGVSDDIELGYIWRRTIVSFRRRFRSVINPEPVVRYKCVSIIQIRFQFQFTLWQVSVVLFIYGIAFVMKPLEV